MRSLFSDNRRIASLKTGDLGDSAKMAEKKKERSVILEVSLRMCQETLSGNAV